MTDADYYPNFTTAWQAWMNMCNEFTTNVVRSSLNWFDLLWKVWSSARASAPKADDDSNRHLMAFKSERPSTFK